MAAKYRIPVSQKYSCDQKIWKIPFRKEFFNEIWLKVGEYEYIYIFETNLKKKIFCLKLAAKTRFVDLYKSLVVLWIVNTSMQTNCSKSNWLINNNK